MYIRTCGYSFGINRLDAFGRMAKYSRHLLLACLTLLVLLFAKLESRSLEAIVERKKTPAAKGSSRELIIQKSQLLKASFAKEGLNFPNIYDSKRLGPEGPDPRHH